MNIVQSSRPLAQRQQAAEELQKRGFTSSNTAIHADGKTYPIAPGRYNGGIYVQDVGNEGEYIASVLSPAIYGPNGKVVRAAIITTGPQPAGYDPAADPIYQADVAYGARQQAERLAKIKNGTASPMDRRTAEDYEARFPSNSTPASAPIAPEPPAPGTTTTEINNTAALAAGHKVVSVELPVAEITVDNNLVPQFKENANPKTGEVQGQELQGQRYERPANAIVVWELRDGRKVVVTGRHRLALAKRLGEKTIPTTIVREADGFTRANALTLDAQFNIRDGNGSLDDYANYFKNTAISESDARAAGLLDRAQGKAGWILGRAASDDLTALYRAGKIEAREALAIARTAPSDAGAQQVGIKFALAGRPAAFIENVMRATQAEVGARETTIDMFGADDSAMQQMAERAERAGQFQRELRDQIQAVQGAAKRPEAARKLGVDVNDPEGVAKKVAELKAELTRWENWPTEPDLMAKVKGEPAPAEGDPRSGQAAMFGYDDSGFALERPPGEHVSAPTEAELAEQARIRAANEAQQGKMFEAAPPVTTYKPKHIVSGMMSPDFYYEILNPVPVVPEGRTVVASRIVERNVTRGHPLWRVSVVRTAAGEHYVMFEQGEDMHGTTAKAETRFKPVDSETVADTRALAPINNAGRKLWEEVTSPTPNIPRASSGAAGRMGSAPAPRGNRSGMAGRATSARPEAGSAGRPTPGEEQPQQVDAAPLVRNANVAKEIERPKPEDGWQPHGNEYPTEQAAEAQAEKFRAEQTKREFIVGAHAAGRGTFEIFSRPVRVESMGGSAPRSRTRVAAAEDATPDTPQQQRASSLALVQDLQRAQAIVAPQTAGPLSRQAANIIREVTGQQALVMAQASERLEKFRGQFDRTPVVKGWAWPTEGGKESGVRSQESEPKPLPVGQVKLPANYAFIDAYEGGGAAAVAPELRPVAEELARQNQVLMLDRLHALGDGVLKEGIEFYFPHVWKDPTKAAAFLSKWIARNPLEGSKSFLKERTHALFIDGLKAGLEPISDNPVDMWLLKLHEVNRFIAGRTIAKMFAERGLTKFVSVFARPPEGWHALDDVAFTKWGPPTVTIKEAYDEGMRQSVLDVLAKLGVPHERLATLRGKTWGLAYNMRNPANNLPGKIKSRFAGPDWVIWHELGHVLDFRYPELRTVMFGGDPSEVRSVRARVAFKHKLAPEHNDIMQRDAELRALADARAGIGKEIPESFQKYLRKTSEKMAVVLQAYLHAPALMAKIAPTIKAAFEKFLHDHPELRIIDDIKPTLELGSGTAEKALPGMVKLGQHFAPAEVAGVVNNFLKPGLQKWAVYRTLREVSNSLNSAQLIGFFHAGFTSIDAVVSRVSLGITAAMNGDVRDGARVFASVPLSLVTNVRRGIALRRAAVMTPEELAQEPAEMQAVVRALAAGGGRVGMDRVWQTQFRRRMVRAIHQARAQLAAGEWLGGLASYGGAALKAPFALVEQIMHPILEWLVPRQKLGVFYDMAARALKEIPANAPDGAEREVMRRIWDNVEDRLGQITYDNLFINRSIKDVALLAFRAFGWQLTKYRAFGGAAIDAAKYVRDSAAYGKAKVTGKPGVPPPDWTERMSYPMALAIVVGIIGGLIHYLYTGRRPVGMDYFQPQTGELDRNGNPVRLNLPSYIKDIVAYSKHPLTSFGHSLNPMLSAGWDLLNNRDFYNTQIHNPEDPWGEQAKEIAQWGAGELVPFSVSGAMQLHDDGSPLWKQVAPWFGFTPVPQRLTMTPAQELASELMAAAMPQQAMTRAEFAKKKTLKDIVAMIKNGASADAMPELAGAIQRGDLNAASLHVMLEKLRMTPLQFQVHMMTAEAALRVWQVANPDERAMLWPLLHSKLTNSKTMTPQQKGAARIMLNNGRPESPEPVTAP